MVALANEYNNIPHYKLLKKANVPNVNLIFKNNKVTFPESTQPCSKSNELNKKTITNGRDDLNVYFLNYLFSFSVHTPCNNHGEDQRRLRCR